MCAASFKMEKNYSLKNLNTFGINAFANYFSEINSVQETLEILDNPISKQNPLLLIGGGSNLLFTKNFAGLVLKNNIKGIELIKEDADYFYVKSGAGVVWHQLVLHCIENNYAGIENLSLIPGNVGAGPMQNIGAYGVELKDVFYELEALHIQEKQVYVFSNSDCKFGYRESVFKRELKNKFIITSVTLRLNKKPVFKIEYGAIQKELETMGIQNLSIGAISKAVCNIRSSKLPDPNKIGNAGSFFKNPIVSVEKFDSLKNNFPEIIGYKNSEHEIKLAAGWLIEQCGWKGKIVGNAGVHKDQALVLVNYGNANGQEIFDLSEAILQSVKNKFDVQLEREVNII